MKLKPRQERELKIVEWFTPTNCDWSHRWTALSDGLVGLNNVVESKDGVSPEQAFFMRSERGRFPERVNNLPRLRALLWGKTWRERHLSEMWEIPYISLYDIKDEPEHIREFISVSFFHLKGFLVDIM